MEFITVVSCIVISAENEIGQAVTYLGEGEDFNEVIAQVKSDALDNYSDEGASAGTAYRVIINVNKVPMPTVLATIVHADIPQGDTDAIVTATVS